MQSANQPSKLGEKTGKRLKSSVMQTIILQKFMKMSSFWSFVSAVGCFCRQKWVQALNSIDFTTNYIGKNYSNTKFVHVIDVLGWTLKISKNLVKGKVKQFRCFRYSRTILTTSRGSVFRFHRWLERCLGSAGDAWLTRLLSHEPEILFDSIISHLITICCKFKTRWWKFELQNIKLFSVM